VKLYLLPLLATLVAAAVLLHVVPSVTIVAAFGLLLAAPAFATPGWFHAVCLFAFNERGELGAQATLTEIDARMGEIRSELEQLGAVEGDLDDTQTTRWTELNTEWDGLAERRLPLVERQAKLDKIRGLSLSPANVEDGAETRSGPAVHRSDDPFDQTEVRRVGGNLFGGRELRDRALSALERSDFVADEHRDRVENLLRRRDTREGALARHVLVTGSDAYRDAWVKVLNGRAHELSGEERQAMTLERAMSLTSANGGYAVPFTLDPTIILTNAGTINPLRQIARVRTTVTNNWHGVTSAGVTAGYDAEADRGRATTRRRWASRRSRSRRPRRSCRPSIEIVQDFGNDLAADLVELFADARDRLEANKFTLGAGHGSDEPKGVITAVAAVGGSVVGHRDR
jgi:HK97 family phage major capsid protein